jgi:hypothetical protein
MSGLTSLEQTLLDWAIDQGFGTKTGNEIVTVINPIAAAIEGGATVEQALLATAIALVGNVKVNNATVALLLPVIVSLATAVENGETIEQALAGLIAKA